MTKVMQKIWQSGAAIEPDAHDVAAPTALTPTTLPAEATSRFVAELSAGGETVTWPPAQVDEAIVAFHSRHSGVCEQYRGLRARLLSMNPTRTAQVIAITSAVPEEGKSVSALNLALIMAEGGEQRVLLADADFRRTSIARMLGIRGAPGLADVLRGERPAAAVQPSPWPNLKILPAGKVPQDNYGELLGSSSTAAVLDEFRSAFDYTFLDTPPITTVSDVCSLTPQCDGAIVVIRMRATAEPTVQQAVRTLQANHIKVLGAILSRFEKRGPGYYDYYDYSEYRE
jgi:receptor protein-tyrosine kinase